MKDKQEEIDAINIQLIALLISLASVIISIIITYNQKLNLEGINTVNPKKIFDLTIFNRLLILVLSLIFLYVNYKLYKISKKEGEDLKPYILQLIASILTIIASIIAIYIVSLSTKENIVDIENPII